MILLYVSSYVAVNSKHHKQQIRAVPSAEDAVRSRENVSMSENKVA